MGIVDFIHDLEISQQRTKLALSVLNTWRGPGQIAGDWCLNIPHSVYHFLTLIASFIMSKTSLHRIEEENEFKHKEVLLFFLPPALLVCPGDDDPL